MQKGGLAPFRAKCQPPGPTTDEDGAKHLPSAPAGAPLFFRPFPVAPVGRLCTILDTAEDRSRPRRHRRRFRSESVLQPTHGSAGGGDGGVERHRARGGGYVRQSRGGGAGREPGRRRAARGGGRGQERRRPSGRLSRRRHRDVGTRGDRRGGGEGAGRHLRPGQRRRHHRFRFGREHERRGLGSDDGHQRPGAVPADARGHARPRRRPRRHRQRVERDRIARFPRRARRTASARRRSIS